MVTMSPGDRLRALLAEPGPLPLACCFNGMSARLLAQSGFRLAALSGFEAAAMNFGLPDTGYLTLSDLVETMRCISRAAPELLVLADGETGYGSPSNVRYTVMEHARAGAAAVMIEDQVWPRRCPFLPGGTEVIPQAESGARMRAALDAAGEAGVMILARTDARASLGFEEALNRSRMFYELGAEMLVMEGLETEDEIARFCAATPLPTFLNLHPGIKTPFLSPEKIKALGVKVPCYHPLLPSALQAMQDALRVLEMTGSYEGGPPMTPFREMARLAGFDDYVATESRYAEKGTAAQ